MRGALDINGDASEKAALFAYLNASYESGFNNPIDEAVRQCRTIDISGYAKLAEIPYDFHRKRLSILASHAHGNLLISKGALNSILAICSTAENPGGESVPLDSVRENIHRQYAAFSRQGIRTLGLAYKAMPGYSGLSHADEADLCFLGYLLFFDPPKQDCRENRASPARIGCQLEDHLRATNRLVASTLSEQLGLNPDAILTGGEISQLNSKSLMHQAASVEVFAEVEPNQKEQIILALKKAGFVVGYMGDGINDVSALHAADVGISVGQRSRCRQGNRADRAHGKRPSGVAGGHPGREDNLRKHPEIRVHGYQF